MPSGGANTLGPLPVACCTPSPETSLAGRPDQQDAGLCELDIVVLELHFSPEGSAARQAEAFAHPDNHVGGPRLALLPFHNLSLCKSQNASRRFFLRVPLFAAGNVRYWGNGRKHSLVARFSQFDPNRTWRFRVSPQMSSAIFSRLASTSTVIWRGRNPRSVKAARAGSTRPCGALASSPALPPLV